MPTRNRKRAVLVSVRGVILVLLAVILQVGGVLGPLESLLYDERVRHCQGDQPQPAAALVHLDVDDNALNYIGHWPWPPEKLARIVDEIALAKPKVLAMDVIFAEAKGVVYARNDSKGVDEDQMLADAFGRLGCAVLPVSLTLEGEKRPSELRSRLLPLLIANPELTRAQCAELLRSSGLTDADLDRDPTDPFVKIQESAFYERIWRAMPPPDAPAPDPALLKHQLLAHADPLLTDTYLGQLFDEQYAQVIRERAMLRFMLPMSAAGRTPLLQGVDQREKTPILPMANAAAYSGFVDDLPETVEGTVRSVPLFARYRDRIVPHIGLVAACAVLGVDVRNVRLSDSWLTIPAAPGRAEVKVPVSVRDSAVVGEVGSVMEVPLFGRPRDWKTMYDVPRHQLPVRQVSIIQVWQACQTLDKIAINEASTDQTLVSAIALSDYDAAKAYQASPLVGEAKRQKIADQLNILNPYITYQMGSAENVERAKLYRRELPLLLLQTQKLREQLASVRGGLYAQLHDRAIFFGGTATGVDLKPTSLFGPTPGVMIHGAVCNAILTGKMWRQSSGELGMEITALLGLVTLLLVSLLSPGWAFMLSLLLGGGYLAINGYVLFARDNLIVAAAGPLLAVGLVWAGMTLGNYLTERTEHARIARRFRSYVDPQVVDFVQANPNQVRFDGEQRELTIGFSDLAGFTTLTDQMGEKVVPLLAEYVGEMVPIIRGQQGTFDKQIGDGLCFFFGAPRPDANHAFHAVKTALDMHAALARFNQTLSGRGLATLGMRIGMATGDVIVGDAGPPNASSYTTLGGTTNLAARLEPVNKLFGTRTLITQRTLDLMHGEFLTRPIANIRVAGKLNCVVVHEPLCLIADAADRDREISKCTSDVFEAYRVADFARCIQAAKQLEDKFGPSKFARYYLHLAKHPPADLSDMCDGQIVLTEK
jgi:class 3 adenylate cyclase